MAGEKNFENRVKRYLDERGCWHVKFFANRNTRSGVPDILACVGGTFVGIEVKGPRGRPSPLQVYHTGEIARAGGVAVIAWPNDFAALRHVIDTLSKGGGAESVQDLIFEGRYLHPVPAEVRVSLH